MSQKNILIAHYRPDLVSGAEKAIVDLITPLTGQFNFVMLVPGPGPLADYYTQVGLNVWVEQVSTPRRLFPGLHTMQSAVMASKLQKGRIDAVVCNTFAAASRMATASRMAGIPHAIYAREYIHDKPVYRKILHQADLILAVSEDVRTHYQPIAGNVPVRVAYDNILVEAILERIASCEKNVFSRLPFDHNEPVAGWVGRITPYKQPELFVRAIPTVLDQVPQARFVLVGEASAREKALEERLKHLAFELGVSDRISFLGRRNDVLELMCEMSAFCLTSTREPFARVILEAQTVGCPVVAPYSGGVPEVIQNEVNGLLFELSLGKCADSPGRKIDPFVERSPPGQTACRRRPPIHRLHFRIRPAGAGFCLHFERTHRKGSCH